MKKLLIGLIGGLFAITSFASTMPYDQIPITSQTWEEVNLTYDNYIHGKKHVEHVNLLRPISWVQQNNLDKVNKTVRLTKEQIGTDGEIKVNVIKPAKLNYSSNGYKNIKPVIATYITHTNNVWDYTFEDEITHKREIIRVAPEHPFYSVDKKVYIPIGKVEPGAVLKTATGDNVVLVNSKKHNDKVEYVYNFEVYQNHNYMAGYSQVLVHNPNCTELAPEDNALIDSLSEVVKNLLPGTKRKYPAYSVIQIKDEDAGGGVTALWEPSGDGGPFVALDFNQRMGQHPAYEPGSYTKGTDNSGTFRLIKEAYRNEIVKSYTMAGYTLHEDTWNGIDGLSGWDTSFEDRNKLPGMHADVVAYNYGRINNFRDDQITLATVGRNGQPLPACLNCGSIIPDKVRIITGRYTPASVTEPGSGN